MNKLISIFGILPINIFFAVSSIIGFEYKGIEDSKIYVFYCLVVAILSFTMTIRYFVFKDYEFTYRELTILIFLPMIVLSLFLFEGILNGGFNPLAKAFFSYFLLWSVPATYIAIYVNKLKIFGDIVKWFELLMVMFSLSIINSTIIPFISGVNLTTLGGASYQSASYIAAFAYGLNLYFLFFGDNHLRFNFAKSKIYKYICIMLLSFQLMGIFLWGGRGATVLSFIYSIYILFSVIKSKKSDKIIRLSLFVLFFVLIMLVLLPILLENEVFASGFERTFQFISPNLEINWAGTSNRDIVYLNALNLIKEKLIFGYGLFGFWNVINYPHNIFLEILLNGGIIYLAFALVFFIIFFKKLFKMINIDPRNKFILIIFLYPFTMLMFSGTYMNSSEFWFVIALVFSHKKTFDKR